VRTANVTHWAVGDTRGLWTTVLGSAVLIFDCGRPATRARFMN